MSLFFRVDDIWMCVLMGLVRGVVDGCFPLFRFYIYFGIFFYSVIYIEIMVFWHYKLCFSMFFSRVVDFLIFWLRRKCFVLRIKCFIPFQIEYLLADIL